MSSRSRSRVSRSVVLLASFALLAAACGGDDDAAPTTTAAAPDPGDDGDDGDDGDNGGEPADTTAPDPGDPGDPGTGDCPEIDTSFDADHGEGAGRALSDLLCAAASPLAAEGEPIVIGVQNPEGDPNGSFPEFTIAIEAAAKYVNEELGGLGADIQKGVPGRPIQLEICRMAIAPDESQRCANELVSKNPAMIISTINFFGNQFPVYEGAGVNGLVVTPITIGDFTSPSAFSIGGGGGCLGVHTGLVEFATTEFDPDRVAVPWSDTPPGVVCYYDLEKKPLDVLNGSVPGDAERAGSMPDLQHIGVPIAPASPDVTPQVTEVLNFDPDVIVFSAQGADCWNLVSGLGRLGWTPDDIPLVLSGACIDFDAMEAAGPLAEGIYFIGASGNTINNIDTLEEGTRAYIEATTYQGKGVEFGMPQGEVFKGFATQGWNAILSLWSVSSAMAVNGEEISGDSLTAAYAATDGTYAFGSTPLSCATAPAPYIAVCNAVVNATQWDGDSLVPIRDNFSGIDLLAGTEIKPGP
jgi:branched-chain amino acid transport system substrate-binding protein